MITSVFVLVLVSLTSLALTAWLARPDAPIRILDRPNERSLHTVPTPRTGGLAICLSLATGWLVYLALARYAAIPAQIVAGAIIIAGVSVLDDRFGLSQVLRLLIQIVAVVILMQDGFVSQGDLLPGFEARQTWVGGGVTFVMTLWLTNLYNFMDGMDGLAGGMAVIGFGTLALLGAQGGAMVFAVAALAVAAAASGFLWFNFPPARIFMGDSGSTTLGFLVAGFAVWGSREAGIPIWLTLTVFAPFVVDATVTLLRRVARGERIWRAHRSHYYQRLVTLGCGHRRTVLVEYAVMLICAASAWVLNRSDVRSQWIILISLAVGFFLAAATIHRLERVRHAEVED